MLGTLGKSLASALAKFHHSDNVNDEVIDAFLKSVARALIEADVEVSIVKRLRDGIKDRELTDQSSNSRRLPIAQLKRLVHRKLFNSLIGILTPQQRPFAPARGRTNVVMFVGLQGAGKTTTCTKYANYFKKKGWRVGLVCADTFRAGAFDQLKQNATKIGSPFYGSYTIVDPVEISAKGVALFKKEKLELIIVDTSGRHKQEEVLIEEMKAIERAVRPDEIVYVVDSHIGQACFAQAQAFKKAVNVASVIVTKLDGHAKGGGAVSAVVATGCAISFIGTGEGFEAFEQFDAKGFVSRLLGMGDPEKILKAMQENLPDFGSKKTAERLAKGRLTYNDLVGQFKTISSFGGMTSMLSMIPGMGNLSLPQGADEATTNQMKRLPHIVDSMTPAERNCEVELCESRKLRIARGSGSQVFEVEMVITYQRMLSKMMARMHKGMQGMQGAAVRGQAQRRGGGRGRGGGLPQLGGLPGMGNLGELMGNLLGGGNM